MTRTLYLRLLVALGNIEINLVLRLEPLFESWLSWDMAELKIKVGNSNGITTLTMMKALIRKIIILKKRQQRQQFLSKVIQTKVYQAFQDAKISQQSVSNQSAIL